MNQRKIKIIAVWLVAILIVWGIWKRFGNKWGIGIGILLLAVLWYGMSFSLGGPNGWQTLFGSYASSGEPKTPKIA